MTDRPSSARFKAVMPQIPGVTGSPRPPRRNPLLPLIIGFLMLGLVSLATARWFSRSRPAEISHLEPTPQIEVPSPPPDPTAALPHATELNPTIATVANMAKPWSSSDFFIKNKLTNESIPATVVRLPGGSAYQSSGYWAYTRRPIRPISGTCELEYITDLRKLQKDYGYRATHPLVGNPCSRTLYDPLKMASLVGNVWIRGAIVQGSDIRPPYGVEIKVKGQEILALRTE